ncbi:MAG: ExbD/TolR family protein [Dehalococcoidia bacterium]
MQGADRRTTPVLSEINVTPLVDVMLVLLIIFMVTAPMLIQGIPVDLPREEGEVRDLSQNLVITVSRNDRIYFRDRRMTLNELEERLRRINRLPPDREVFIKADRDVSYGTVVKAMARVRRAGFDRLGMVTEPVE